jgi:hypothetical protein
MEHHASAIEILERARQTLAVAEKGVQDLRGKDPSRWLPGLLNVAVFGRAVTNILQNLRSVDQKFDPWYAPKVLEMRADKLLRFFYELRTEVLKTARRVPTAHRTHIKHLELPKDLARMGPKPPGTTGFFIGDSAGGSGWLVRLPNGTQVPYYVDLPDDIGVVDMTIRGAPLLHLGQPVLDDSAASLSSLYVNYLRNLLDDADKVFGH